MVAASSVCAGPVGDTAEVGMSASPPSGNLARGSFNTAYDSLERTVRNMSRDQVKYQEEARELRKKIKELEEGKARDEESFRKMESKLKELEASGEVEKTAMYMMELK